MAGDPVMPEYPPKSALDEINRQLGYRNTTAVDIYRSIREALIAGDDTPATEYRMPGDGRSAVQGKNTP